MSENTQCNFCKLTEYRRRAAKANKRIIVRPGGYKDSLPGGFDVFEVPREDFKRLNKESDLEQYKISWMWEIPPSCRC